MNVTVLPISHFCIILDDNDKRKGFEVIETYVVANHIRTLDSKWQYGRTADGHRSVNFNGFVIPPSSTVLGEQSPKGVDSFVKGGEIDGH